MKSKWLILERGKKYVYVQPTFSTNLRALLSGVPSAKFLAFGTPKTILH